MLLFQVNRPKVSGVAKVKVVVRVSDRVPRVVVSPSGLIAEYPEPWVLSARSWANESDGFQVIRPDRAIGFGEKLTCGNCWEIDPSFRFWRRLPPTVRAPQG